MKRCGLIFFVLAATAAPPATAQLAPGTLPLAPGRWMFRGAEGSEVVVAVIQSRGSCVDAAWSGPEPGAVVGMREWWCPVERGAGVAGRGIGNRWTTFDQPYLAVPIPTREGYAWRDAVSISGRGAGEVRGEVGPVEVVETPSGRHRAQRVTTFWSRTRVTRWYAPGIGLVREEQALRGEAGQWEPYRDERVVGRQD